MSVKSQGLYAFLLLWFVACTGLIVWIGTASKSQFDPNMKLSMALMNLSFESDLIASINSIRKAELSTNTETLATDTQASIFHITQGDCYCEWLAQSHISTLTTWSQKNEMTSYKIDLNKHPDLRAFVPSTPAVLAIDQYDQLIYFGPYSRGSGCFSNSGMIDQVLDHWLARVAESENKQVTSLQNTLTPTPEQGIVDTDANGCYCIT